MESETLPHLGQERNLEGDAAAVTPCRWITTSTTNTST